MSGPWREEILGDGQVRRLPPPSARRQNITTIYALIDPDNGHVRYVGKTIYLPERRLTFHINTIPKNAHLPSARWLKKLTASGKRPSITILETVPIGNDWKDRERFWIANFRPNGKLLNLTDGGEGIAGLPRSDATRKKIASAQRRGAEFSCEICGSQFWRRPSAIKSGDCRFCSKKCYQASQRGKSKPISRIFTERGIAAAAAVRASQTHCLRGHPLSGPNLLINSQGHRVCKECRKLHKLNYRSRL